MIASLLVHVSKSTLGGGQVEAAVLLAEQLSARLIGAAAGFLPPPVSSEFGGMPAYLTQQIMDDIKEELRDSESQFRKAASRLPHGTVEWRSAREPALNYLTVQLRAADMAIIGPRDDKDSALWAVGPADMILAAGRPVLMTPHGVTRLDPECAVIAWKDTTQARRAVRDSLDLLRRSTRILVCGVGEEASDRTLEDVVAYLAAHRIEAAAVHERTRGGAGPALRRIAHEEGARMIVAGAYGHSRLREWALGGVTRDLIENAELPCLFSH